MKHLSLVKLALSSALLAFLAMGLAPVASATSTQTTTFTVTATVVNACTISATGLSFGNYTATATALSGQSTVTIQCTSGDTPVNIGLDAGKTIGATVTSRKMNISPSTAGVLSYILTQDAAFATNWGTTVGTDTKLVVVTGAAQVFNIYGQIAANQFVPAGSYTDTITATVTY